MKRVLFVGTGLLLLVVTLFGTCDRQEEEEDELVDTAGDGMGNVGYLALQMCLNR